MLGTVDEGWSVVQEVLAFERVGIARYARCERLLQWRARSPWATSGSGLPDELRGRWARMLMHCRRARLLAYRVVALQETGPGPPGATPRAYRIAVTRLDQESAEVLMEIVEADAPLAGDERVRFKAAVEDHWRYSRRRHRRLGQHRDAAHPAGPVHCWRRREHRTQRDGASEYGQRGAASALRGQRAAIELVQLAEHEPGRAGAGRPRARRDSAHGTSIRGRGPTS